MPYLIDGHNLIPFINGMSLDQLDDELRLIDLLETYFRKVRKKATIFFDRGQPAAEPMVTRGFVTARFTRPPLIADQAIRDQLRRLGRSAANYIVVSSDHEVAEFARRQGAKAVSSRELAAAINRPGRHEASAKTLPNEDLDYWLMQFGENS